MPIALSLSELLDHATGEMKVGEGPLALMGYRSQQVQPTRLRETATAQKMGLSTLQHSPPHATASSPNVPLNLISGGITRRTMIPVGVGLSREAGTAEHGTGFARVRGTSPLPRGWLF